MCSLIWIAKAFLLSRCITALSCSVILTSRHLPVSPMYTTARNAVNNAESGRRWCFPLYLDQQVPESRASHEGHLVIFRSGPVYRVKDQSCLLALPLA